MENIFEMKYVNERHLGGKACLEAVASSLHGTSLPSYHYANDVKSAFRGVRLSDLSQMGWRQAVCVKLSNVPPIFKCSYSVSFFHNNYHIIPYTTKTIH